MKFFVWLNISLLLAGIASAAEEPSVIFASSESPQMIVIGPKNVDPELLSKEIQAARDSFTPELVNTIEEAAGNQEVWDKAIRNPDAFLAEKGFVYRDLSVRLYEAPLTVWERDPTCGPGLVPVKVERWVETCLRRMDLLKCFRDPTTGGVVCVILSVCVRPKWEIQITTECVLRATTIP